MDKNIFYVFVFLSIIITSCSKSKEKEIKEGWVPIYERKEDVTNIEFAAPKIVENPGKIYIKDSLIYLVDKNEGLHIINNSNPKNPKIIGFLKIFGINNVSIKSNILYAENYTDIVAVDISNIRSPIVTTRLKGLNPMGANMAPKEDGWFECVDTTKGIVIGWKKQTIVNPKCFTRL